jgi:FkbM family methyltransferase
VSQTFVSHGQNREDVVLWRALNGVGVGRYVEVGGNDPDNDSISRAFYDRGWSGVVVEPEPTFAAKYREARPLDTVIEAAVSSRAGTVTLHRFADTGLSTLVDEIGAGHVEAGFAGDDLTVPAVRLDAIVAEHGLAEGTVHFMMIDVEGAEADVLSTVDLRVFRPWILVIESTRPNSTETTHHEWESGVIDSGYEFCLFDGLSRFYVAAEKADDLRAALSYPACVLDQFVDQTQVAAAEATARADAADARLIEWRRAALETWASASAEVHIAAVEDVKRLTDLVATLRKRNRTLTAENKKLRARLIKPKVKRVAKAAMGRLR